MKKEVSVLDQSFHVFLDSKFGHVPVIVEDILFYEPDKENETGQLKIQYKLDWDHEKFPEQYKNLEPQQAAEFTSIIDTAIHDAFKKLLEKEAAQE